jgi:DNA-binding transcriptional ArsR family regulator
MAAKYDEELYRLKAEMCKTFADPKRLMIIAELREGEKSVGDLVTNLGVPQALISRHLAVLRNKGIVAARRNGVNIYYRLTNPRITDACDIVHGILLDQVARNKEMAEKYL